MKVVSRIVALAVMFLAAVLIAYHYQEVTAAPSEISSANSPHWDMAPPGIKISGSTGAGANEPSLDVAPNGNIMVVYNHWVTGSNDRDPYFSISNNGGNSWSTPAPIYSSPGINSIQVDIAYSDSGIAHVVWVELVDATPPIQETRLYYSRYNGTSWTAPSQRASVISPLPLIGHPRIVAAGSYIDVVWEEGSPTVIESGGNAAIMHTRSANGGQNWSSNVQISEVTTAPALTAAIDIGPDGRPHAVWRKSLPAGNSEIRYTEATIGAGNQVNWQPPIIVSGVVTNTNQPEIMVQDDGTVRTSFTQSVISGVNSFNQWVYYTFCTEICLTPANWSPAFNTTVEPVEVNDNSPFDVISDIMRGVNGCTYIFFHGLRDGTFGRELVWNVNSCDGWNPQEGWDPVTNDSMRGINPRVVAYQSRVYVAYQRVTDADENSIYFMSGSFGPGGAFLPIIRKKP